VLDVAELVAAASRVLSQQLGTEIRLDFHEMLGARDGNVVMRVCSIQPTHESASTFVIKAGPRTVPHAEEMLWNDWAALEFLGKLGLETALCPRLFGGDPSTPFIVMEDLGVNAADPNDLLDGADPDRAEAALISYMKCLGRLHSATLGKLDQFRLIWQSLGGQPYAKPLYHDPWSCCQGRDSAEILQAIREYKDVFSLLDIVPERGIDDEIESVTRRIEECPEQYSVLCQGDQNGPGGCLYNSLGVRLIDFGACGFRHPLVEGMPHRMTWGCTKQIPRRLYPHLERSYQSELAKGYTAAASDTFFQTAMINAAARWNIFHTIWRVPDALQADRPRGLTSLRQQVLAWLNAFLEMTEEFNQMPSLGNSARRLLSRLKRLWPAETHTIPYYSAFKNAHPCESVSIRG
jgi:hypothetical protein